MSFLPGLSRCEPLDARAAEHFGVHVGRIHRRCDRMFGALLVIQWLAGIAAALWLSPRAWSGGTGVVHEHVYDAVLLGGAIALLPVVMVFRRPGEALTRHVVAAAQLATSALLIHISGGRIETHFHVFGSLAFIAFYRDWRVLMTATAVAVADHVFRGTMWPMSIFGVAAPGNWRWVEHAAWVAFEDVFLVASCVQGRREMMEIARRQADAEGARAAIETEVARRTAELTRSTAELTRSTAELTRSELRMRALVEGTGVIAWEFDPGADAFVFLSPQVLGLGYPMSECLSPGFWGRHVHPDDAELALLPRSSRPQRSQYRFVRADGGVVWMDDVCGGASAESESAMLRGVLVDVTERRRLELHHSQSQRLESIGQLAAGIAHEINTPTQYVGDNVRFLQGQFGSLLMVAERYAELLSGDAGEMSWAERRRAAMETLEMFDYEFLKNEIPSAIAQSLEGLDRVTSIVLAMRDFSHPGSATKEPADLNRSITSTLEVCRNRWKYVAEMETSLAADLPRVPCFIAEFNQVVLNLVVNAADAIAEAREADASRAGLIRVSTALVDGCAEVRVEDNGRGMPESVQRRLFEPFFTTKQVGTGTGQGLAISRDVIVNKHRGTLTFESAPGRGTTFVVRLPLEETEVNEREAA